MNYFQNGGRSYFWLLFFILSIYYIYIIIIIIYIYIIIIIIIIKNKKGQNVLMIGFLISKIIISIRIFCQTCCVLAFDVCQTN